MKYRLVIFDFDGTLADTVPWMISVADELADRHHFPRLSESDLEMLRGPQESSIPRLLKIPRWKLPLIVRDGRRMMTAKLGEIRLFPGVATLMQRLVSQGVRIAMVSSNSESNIRHLLGPEIAGLMTAYECGASFFGKSRKLRRVIKKTGLAPHEILSVGDEMRDLAATLDVGLTFAGVSWGLSHGAALKSGGASIIFNSMEEIGDYVLGV